MILHTSSEQVGNGKSRRPKCLNYSRENAAKHQKTQTFKDFFEKFVFQKKRKLHSAKKQKDTIRARKMFFPTQKHFK